MPRSRLRRTTGAEGLHTHAAEAVVAEIQAAGGRAVASLDSVAKSASAGRIVQAALALDMARYRVRSNCIAP